MKKRILSLLLVLVMLLSLLPAGVLAAEGDVSVTLSGMHDAQVKSLKLYTYMDGVKGADDLLAEKTAADGAYTIDLAPGAYWADGYDANGDCNGGVSINVSSDSSSFKLQRMYQISVNPSSWVKDTDYTLSLRVTDASGAERKAEFGSAVNWGKTYTSCLFVVGDTVSVTATPNAETHPNYNPATASKTPTMNDSLSLTCKEFVTVTVTAPKGSTIDAGTLAKYYVFSFLEPFARSVEDGTATFHLDKNTDYFYRVRHPQGATYWNYVRLSADAAYTITEEDLGLTGDFSKSTIYHFENNVYDRAGIYLNINTKGYKNMAVGETFELNSFRNWFAIESFMNAKVALPEMHYQVIDVNGNPSDVVTITPNALNSNVAVMEAKHEGTAIVLVTYDAMTHMAGQTSTPSHRFSAIWPELTGVFVVNVGADGSAIQTNMNLDRMDAVIEKDEARQLDAEHDILFYTGTEGASYSFKPEAGCTVSVLRPTVTAASMTYSGGFTNTGVTTAEDGTVTVSGLITGRNIIKVTKGGLSTYQVVTARGVSYKFVNAEGAELTQEELAAIKPGDSVTIQFSNLISPKEKLSGAYNFNFSLYMQGPDGTFFKSDPGGNFGVYDFSGNPERQKLTVTIPKFWAEETYTLSGAIKQAGWPGVPTHRGITYAVGTNPGFDAPKTAGILSRLPEITIPVVKLDFLTGKLIFQDQNGTSIDRKNLTVTLADNAGNGIAVAEDGTFKAYAEEYFYTVSGAGVEYATGSVTMKEEGSNEFTITLQATAAGAWDGKTQTEPQTDENGVYQIGTGAELAWFVAKSKDADVSGVLTADINLGKYAWLNISSSKKVVLDGASFEINGLNATAGLFAQIGSNSYIHDLTIRGAVSGKGSAGAIAGYASGTAPKIANCFNYAVITSTGNNVGGLVGYTYQNAVIENCANFGAVTGGSSAGGIIGGTVSNGSTITGCYNTAEISATGSKAGGIIGGTSSEMTVTSCYNTGKISGTASGGIAGEVKGNVNWSGTVQGKITISSCYSTGEAGSAVFGTVDTASSEISKCYYLNTLNADANAEALNEADLKDADLSDAFGPVCGGYPALRWQSDVTFHEAAGEGTVTAPLCTVKGYTSYSCSKCGESYRTAYTAPLGHDFCEDLDGSDNSCVLTAPTCTQPGKIVRTCRRDGCSETKEDIVPAKGHTPKDGTEQVFTGYKTYECAVCGKTYTVWDDDRLGHVSYPEQTVTSISVSDNGNYPWVYNADLDRFESSNQNQDKTSSTTSFAFTLSAPTVLRFGYGVSSENGYDKLTITLAADGGSTETLADAVSGEKSGSIKKQLGAGSYTLTLSYVKDDASKGGSDMAYVSVLTLAGMARVIVENTTFPKAEGAVWEGTLADTWIELTGESTMMGCVVEALDGHTVVGAESNYISSIDDLKEQQGGSMSGWMGTLNDWFTNFGFGEFTVAKGTLCAGDEIRIMYTRTVEDLGGSWNNSDTRLKALTFSAGKLAPKFSGDTFTYTLTVPEGTTSLLVTPTAANKNYQVRAYLGTQATGREYSRTSLIPIANGSVITVVCADDSWPTMNETSDGKRTYTINVVFGTAQSSDAGVASVKVAGVEAAAGTAENSFSVTLPAGTEVTADSFEITLSDSKATLTGPAKGEDGVWTFTVTAEDGTAVTYSVTVTVKEAKTIHATISMQAENMFIMVPTRVEVSSDLAERYGYADDVTDGVSALDVLVKYHEITFGEDFTKDSKSDYLVVSNGTITTVNGEKTSAFSFAVNGEFPCDKNGEYNTQYGYTGYTISQTPVAEDGTVEFFFYQDTSMYMDYYTWFTDTDGNRLDTFTVQAGTDFTLGMDGYMYAYGGGLKPEDRVTHGAALDPEDIQICTVGEDGTLTPVEGKVIGENGQVTLSFAAAGSYVLSAMGDEFTNIFSPWLPVTVTAAPKSNDANVSSITVAGVEATAGENNTYTVTLPYGTDVTAGSFVIVTSDAGATVGALTNEGNVWTFTVTAEDGVTSKTYTVTVSFTEAPKSNDANVSSVTVAGVEATAGENNTYTVTLPYGTDVTAGSFVIVTSDAGATVGALTNEGNVWTFTVTAEDRVTSKTYTVTVSFTEAPKSNDAGVSSITVAGFKAVAGANNSYTVTVPYGTVVKTGSFVIVTRHPRATVSALTNTRNIWSFTVTAEDGVTTAVYTVTVNTAALPEPITPGVDNKKPASKPEVKLPFTDVSTSDWFYDDVAFVYKNGLFSGTDSRSFSPNASMTRAMLVTVLYRLEGEPTVTGRSSFTDVRSGAYYEKAVIWAAANGIVTGTDSTSFSPDAKVTREQLAAILYRYAQYRKLDTDASAKLNSFTDADSVSAYASEALGWAVSEGLINGASGKLMPKGDATRAQVAAILHRFVKNVLN
ncbi:MAG: S-layer homology domain-containing protein [Oscillospiraceae bacterium]